MVLISDELLRDEATTRVEPTKMAEYNRPVLDTPASPHSRTVGQSKLLAVGFTKSVCVELPAQVTVYSMIA